MEGRLRHKVDQERNRQEALHDAILLKVRSEPQTLTQRSSIFGSKDKRNQPFEHLKYLAGKSEWQTNQAERPLNQVGRTVPPELSIQGTNSLSNKRQKLAYWDSPGIPYEQRLSQETARSVSSWDQNASSRASEGIGMQADLLYTRASQASSRGTGVLEGMDSPPYHDGMARQTSQPEIKPMVLGQRMMQKVTNTEQSRQHQLQSQGRQQNWAQPQTIPANSTPISTQMELPQASTSNPNTSLAHVKHAQSRNSMNDNGAPSWFYKPSHPSKAEPPRPIPNIVDKRSKPLRLGLQDWQLPEEVVKVCFHDHSLETNFKGVLTTGMRRKVIPQ